MEKEGLPNIRRRCRRCGSIMVATRSFPGGWTHREKVVEYACSNCGHAIELESHDAPRGWITVFFLVIEAIVFVFDGSPSYPSYAIGAAVLLALLIAMNLDRIRNPVVDENGDGP